MARVIDFKSAKDSLNREEQKNRLRDALDELFWRNPEAYVALCNFCDSSRYKLHPAIKTFLIKEGFLAANGSLPSITNEVIFEASTGEKPFWLN